VNLDNPFLGFTYGVGRFYPIRAQRNIIRAEQEMMQLLPRAITFGREREVLPILIRPPFTGEARLRGSGFAYRDDQGEVIVVTSHLSFSAARERAAQKLPRVLGLIGSETRYMSFSPILSLGGIVLTELDAKVPYHFPDLVETWDVRSFPAQIAWLKKALENNPLPSSLAILRTLGAGATTQQSVSVSVSASFVTVQPSALSDL
jgi:hypothetical protein